MDSKVAWLIDQITLPVVKVDHVTITKDQTYIAGHLERSITLRGKNFTG